MWSNTTSVPNVVFDLYLKDLNIAELKVLLVIIRQTLGWKDKQTKSERKECDWISGSQLTLKTGASNRAINTAIRILVEKKLIDVLDVAGNLLDSPEKRKGKQKLFFRLATANFTSVENKGSTCSNSSNSSLAYAKNNADLRKKVQELAKNMRYTKETLTK